MARLVFTGPSHLADADRDFVAVSLRSLAPPSHVTTGGAEGVDILVAELAMELWPRAVHRIVYPDAPYAVEGVARLRAAAEASGVRLTTVPAGPAAEPYRARNEAMFFNRGKDTDLIAFLRAPEFYRSGEWMTVNIARKLGVPVRMFVFPQETT